MSCDWCRRGHVTRCSPLIGPSVLTHAPLKILSNYFVVSLAVADLTVSILEEDMLTEQIIV